MRLASLPSLVGLGAPLIAHVDCALKSWQWHSPQSIKTSDCNGPKSAFGYCVLRRVPVDINSPMTTASGGRYVGIARST